MILKESVMIYSLGALFWIGIREIVRRVIITVPPTLSCNDWIRSCIFGWAVGTASALYPAYKAARMDPVRALSYE